VEFDTSLMLVKRIPDFGNLFAQVVELLLHEHRSLKVEKLQSCGNFFFGVVKILLTFDDCQVG